MNKLLKTVLIILIAMNSSYSGERDAHGGGAIVCRDRQNEIKTAQLLDIWEYEIEGKNIDHLGYINNLNFNEALENILSIIKKKISESFYDNLYKELKIILAKHQLMTEALNVEIMPPKDSNLVIFKKGCNLEGVAFYRESYRENDGVVFISSEIYNRFDQLSKTVLFVHEAFYKIFRDRFAIRNSILIRALVRDLLSNRESNSLFQSNFLTCKDRFGDHSFVIEGKNKNDKKLSRIILINSLGETVPYGAVDRIFLNKSRNQRIQFKLLGRGKGAHIVYKSQANYLNWKVEGLKSLQLIRCQSI